MDDPFTRPTPGSGVFYKNPVASLEWLEKGQVSANRPYKRQLGRFRHSFVPLAPGKR